jgi:hypothetical protein
MVESILECAECREGLIKSYPGGKKKLRTNILIFENGECIVKCPRCKADQRIPIKLEGDGRKHGKGDAHILLT